MEDGSVNLPPGFRFCPTDEELVLHFLYHKIFLLPCHPNIIPDIEIRLHDPWDLINGMALSSGNAHYFFSKVREDDRRVTTANGYWKDLHMDEPILTSSANKVGVKRYFVFCVAESETNWVMEEFNLCHHFTTSTTATTASAANYKRQRKQKLVDYKWVLCRVHERKDINDISGQTFCHEDDNGTELSCLDEMFFSLLDDDLEEISLQR